jgi:MFS family permease
VREAPTTFAGRTIPLEDYSPFRRLAIVHAAMMGADAAMVVALADTVFFSVDPQAARDKVLLFLVISFAPFLVLAPLIGPLLDRIAGGRRAMIQFVGISRVVLSIVMAVFVDDVVLFPLVFIALVLQKTYIVSKSALVPSVVRSESDLIEANSKLGLISGIVGMVAVLPAGIIRLTPLGSSGILVYAALIFLVALVAATWLSADVVASNAADDQEQLQLHSSAIQLGSLVMVLLRSVVGFVFFLIAMVLKEQGADLATYGTAVSAGAIGTFLGNAVAVRVRRRLSERLMLLGSLGLSGVAGFAAAVVGGTGGLVILSFSASLAAAIGRMGFEAILQKEAPAANRGRAFASFETRFQFGWAIAGLVPVVIVMSGSVGALLVGLLCAGGLLYALVLPKVAPGVTITSLSGKAAGRLRTRVHDRRTAKAEAKAHRADASDVAGESEPGVVQGASIDVPPPPSDPASAPAPPPGTWPPPPSSRY